MKEYYKMTEINQSANALKKSPVKPDICKSIKMVCSENTAEIISVCVYISPLLSNISEEQKKDLESQVNTCVLTIWRHLADV